MSFMRGEPYRPVPTEQVPVKPKSEKTAHKIVEKKEEVIQMSEPMPAPAQPIAPVKVSEPEAPVTMTFLSPNLKMRDATIESPEEDITVLGSFDGHIRCRHLFVGPNAVVSGHIVVDSARIEGKLAGNIEGQEMYANNLVFSLVQLFVPRLPVM
jgi:hypothetical protein